MSAKKPLSNRMEGLTGNQRIYFEYIIDHICNFHSFPTNAEVSIGLGVSNNASFEMIQRLTRKGFLNQYEAGKYRVTNVIFTPKFVRNKRIKVKGANNGA